MKQFAWPIGIVLTFVALFSSASMYLPKVEPKARTLWENEDLLLSSLTRYNEVYYTITDEDDREDFAHAYLSTIVRDVFLLPKGRADDNIQVILPAKVEGQTVMALKEIQLGPDNGLRKAMHRIIYKPRRFQPPFYSPKLEKLLDYVLTGRKR